MPETYAALAGHLYVAATPIGNLQDGSDRLKSVLKTCTHIACESKAVTRTLLHHLEVQKPLISYRDKNESSNAEVIVLLLQQGAAIVLVSDAGTPTISDPGFRVVRACRRVGLPVVPIPGPTAFVTALSASGLPSHAFLFLGFLPPKSIARQKILGQHRFSEHTLIFYESCHRIQKSVEDMLTVFGPERVVCIAKEITKYYETFWVGPLMQVEQQLKKSVLKGEFVGIVAPESYQL